MKISAVIGNPSINITKTVAENKSAIGAFVVIVSGLVVGSMVYIFNNKAIVSELLEYFISFVTDFSQKNKPEIFSGLLIPDLIYLAVMFILGTCAFGTVAINSLSLVYSMGLGLLVAYIYDSFALKGIEYCLMVLLPGKFFFVLAMILLTQNCAVTSKLIKQSVYNKNDRVVDFRKYNIRIFVISIIIVVSAFVDFLTIISFSSLFEFA